MRQGRTKQPRWLECAKNCLAAQAGNEWHSGLWDGQLVIRSFVVHLSQAQFYFPPKREKLVEREKLCTIPAM